MRLSNEDFESMAWERFTQPISAKGDAMTPLPTDAIVGPLMLFASALVAALVWFDWWVRHD